MRSGLSGSGWAQGRFSYRLRAHLPRTAPGARPSGRFDRRRDKAPSLFGGLAHGEAMSTSRSSPVASWEGSRCAPSQKDLKTFVAEDSYVYTFKHSLMKSRPNLIRAAFLAAIALCLLVSTSPTPVQAGSGYALSFDGVDDYVTVPDHDALTFTNAFTWKAWVNVTKTQWPFLEEWVTLFAKNVFSKEYWFSINSYTGFKMEVRFDSQSYSAESSNIVPLQSWQHLAVTAPTMLPATNANLAVGAVLGDLTPGQTVHFRLVATNSAGAVTGHDLSFQTPIFTDINAGLPGVQSSSLAWGDYDNDGRLDVLLTGWTGPGSSISRVYRNLSPSKRRGGP